MFTQAAQFLLWILAGLIVLLLPGAAWLAWFRRPGQDLLTALADAAGLSIAITAIVALLTFLLDFRISAGLLIVLTALLLLLLGAGLLRRRPARPGAGVWLGLLGLAGVVAWRLYQARSLVFPAWVDSVHHVLIVQAILQRGGLPSSLSPFVPVPLYYHYGFHALAALYTIWSQLPVERAVLLLGQAINALVGLSIFRLGMCLWSDWRRAAAAGLLSMFAFHMPAYYLTWGRYPLLAGLVILPLAMSAAVEISRQTEWHGESFARLAVLTGGLFLTHYLAALVFAVFLIVLGVQRAWQDLRSHHLERPGWSGLVAGIAVGMVIGFPWIYRIWVYSSSSFGVATVLGADAPDRVYFSGYASYLWYLAGPLRNQILLGVAVVGVLVALRNSAGRPVGIWGLLLGLLSLPYGIRLGPFRPDLIVILLFLPGALLIADLVFTLGDLVQKWAKAIPLGWAFGGLLVLGACVWGIVQTRDILNPSTVFADRADADALQWIVKNTPANARFFINTTSWQGSLYRGVDGGWWILPLTGRQTLLPPVAYAWGAQDYVLMIDHLAQQASQVNGCTPGFWDIVRADRLDYVYLHKGQGSLQPEALQNCPGVAPIYHFGPVSIYRLTPPAG